LKVGYDGEGKKGNLGPMQPSIGTNRHLLAKGGGTVESV